MLPRAALWGVVLFFGLVTSTVGAFGQINPANFRSGFADYAAGGGSRPLFTVPADSRFVLTDWSWAPTDSTIFCSSGITKGTWAAIIQIYGSGVARWSGMTNSWYNSAPVQLEYVQEHLTTGLAFDPGSVITCNVVPCYGPPPSRLCWSGYLVSATAASVLPSGPTNTVRLGILPNPSRGSSQVQFELTDRMNVVVAIFDIHGRKVKTLYSGAMDGGPHALIWDGRDEAGRQVADGMYLARLDLPRGSGSRKVARIR